jgi:ATP synthase protein I
MVDGRRAFVGGRARNVALVPRDGKQLNAGLRLASVGIELAISTVIGLLGGRWLDDKLGTEPYLMIVGLVLGVTAGFRSLFLAARKANRATQSESESNPHGPPE